MPPKVGPLTKYCPKLEKIALPRADERLLPGEVDGYRLKWGAEAGAGGLENGLPGAPQAAKGARPRVLRERLKPRILSCGKLLLSDLKVWELRVDFFYVDSNRKGVGQGNNRRLLRMAEVELKPRVALKVWFPVGSVAEL